MIQVLRLILAVALSMSAGMAAAGQMRVKPVTIFDRNGFEKPLPAGRLLVPHDWKARGGYFWPPGNLCQAQTIQSDFVATSPDGLWTVRMAGGVGWKASSMPVQSQRGDCQVSTIGSVEEFLRAQVQAYRPDAQILHLGRRLDLEKANGLGSLYLPPVPGTTHHLSMQIGELAIRYSENGTSFDEAARVIVIISRVRMEGGYGVPPIEVLNGQAMPFLVMRAPAGQLKPEYYNFVESSYRIQSDWNWRMQQHFAKMNKIALKGIKDRAEINRKHSQDMFDILRSGYKSRSKIQDRMHEKTTDAIRGVEPYVDSETGERVKLPHEYGHAWKLDDGSYLVTDNPNLNPNVDWQINARRMQRGGY